ncbi:MAG: cytochrome o ubiquinol oxidase subunit IV [Sphingomonas sp.]|uniref:cytochrome o ubiquinol oxidase subunit IV n=1 Tax=Sphingomonas sp. TaxID=28214 RepID=UPI001AFE4AE7|nr:cytochrome o ubiquinol oxidase subunit IV [Sphingomonas sp.]MBO9624293.1 cytochrome o ubiquinol oxidase subunit IV [Sphingomonas sp.]
MNDATHKDAAHGHGDTHGHAFTIRGYLTGFLLSVVLTALPFWMVMSGNFDPHATAITIIAFAVLQIIVHTVSFLHLNSSSEGGWTLMAYIFTAVIVLIVISGSLWIMFHLNANMMPMSADGGFGS